MKQPIHQNLRPAPTQEAILTVSDEQLIKLYNLNLTLSQHPIIIAMIKGMKEQLISRNIITEDHEGEIVT